MPQVIEAVLVDAAARSPAVDRLLAALPLQVFDVPGDTHGLSLDRRSVGVFGSDHPHQRYQEHCHAWYVGPGACPSWMRPAIRGAGAVLALLGTAMVQERAGAAFRAAGAGTSVLDEADLDGLLAGVDLAVGPRPPVQEAPRFTWVAGDRDRLLHKAFAVLDSCCHPGGAIAAAPPRCSADEPDYSFFWQRDAAAAASALHGLAREGPGPLRQRARDRLTAYVSFVAAMGREPDLVAASRCTLDGTAVGGYGNPQHDGPAATALLLLAVVEDPSRALDLARPFLDHLLALGVGGTGFDLWELVQGRSFHAANLRRRALLRAADAAERIGDPSSAGLRIAGRRLTRHLEVFLDPRRRGYVHSLGPDPAWFSSLSRLDASVLGSELLSRDEGPALPGIAATQELLEAAFASRWPVNDAWRAAGHRGGGIGRFPEDCNDGLRSSGGNPWPVTTLWAAQWHLSRGSIELGLGYLEFVLAHGGGSEQVDGTTGLPCGAVGLAWSAGELVTTLLLPGVPP